MVNITEIIEVLCLFIGLPSVLCFGAYKCKKIKQEKKALKLKREWEEVRLQILNDTLSMIYHNHGRQWLVCSLAVVLSSCASVVCSAPYEERAAVYTFAADAQENDNDFSYPITGTIAATGTLAYIPQGLAQNERCFGLSEHTKHPPLSPSPDTEILASGLLRRQSMSTILGFVKIHTQNPNGAPPIWLVEDCDHYTWEGEIAFNGASKKAQFAIYTYVINGGVKLIETYNAEKQQTGMEFMYAVTGADPVINKPPFKWGTFICDSASYRLYCGVETDYYATYPSFIKAEWKTAQWASIGATHIDSYFTFFLKPGQKFQLLNKAGEVAAELFGNIYTIYDTLPESEWDSMKQNMALFYVYRLIAQRFFYSDNERFSF
jgi:hypothetical protein